MGTTESTEQDRGPATRFRRAVWLQIYLPLAAGAILVVVPVAIGLVAGGRGGPSTSGMADVALVALLLPAMLLGVLALAVIVALSVGTARLIGWIPDRSGMVRRVVAQAAWQSDRIARRTAQVIVVPKSIWRTAATLWERLSGRE